MSSNPAMFDPFDEIVDAAFAIDKDDFPGNSGADGNTRAEPKLEKTQREPAYQVYLDELEAFIKERLVDPISVSAKQLSPCYLTTENGVRISGPESSQGGW